MRSMWFLVLTASFPISVAAESDTPDSSSAPVIEEVLVEGEYPGPGLWQVKTTDDASDHVLWIVAEPPPLPKKMKWKSAEIEHVVRNAQEILFPSALVVMPDERIGFFKGMSLVPAALGARKNPDKATLQDVLPQDLYARWRALKKTYLPRNRGIERWRPLFAAEKLQGKAFSKSGFGGGDVVRSVVSQLAEKHQVEVTTPSLHFTFETKSIKPALKRFSRERLDDIDCFATTLDLVEAISDRDTMHLRAHAWATADLVTLSSLPALPDPSNACAVAFLESTIAQDIIPPDIEMQLDMVWMNEAEASLAENESTLAILPLAHVTGAQGYLARLREKGYVVIEPGQKE